MYGFEIKISGALDATLIKVREALAKEGFGVLFDINVQGVLKSKLDVDSQPYHILGACNPNYAHRALASEPNIGLLLPCNVIVRENSDGQLTIAFIDPSTVLTLVDKPEIAPVAELVRAALMRVRDSLIN